LIALEEEVKVQDEIYRSNTETRRVAATWESLREDSECMKLAKDMQLKLREYR
jgi:hypothetical protein